MRWVEADKATEWVHGRELRKWSAEGAAATAAATRPKWYSAATAGGNVFGAPPPFVRPATASPRASPRW